MDRKDWRTISVDDVDFDSAELARQLGPALPFTDAERAFLDLLLDRGEVDASILTSDATLQERIQAQPLLEWKALNVRRHKGLS